jgi:2-methylcitrate dehydratase PrpD
MNLTRRLAELAAGLRYDDLPADIRLRGRMLLLDAVGVMLGGVAFHHANGDRFLARYLEDMAPVGTGTVVGYERRTTPAMCAFANGVLSQVLDCQDTSVTGKIHTGAAVIPAALATAEMKNARGKDLIAALIAGYEVANRVAVALQPAHWFGGFQATGTIGTIGAAAATGSLLGLTPRDMEVALGMAGTILPLSNGDSSFKGYTAKTVQAGEAATRGIEAAFMARAGFTAGPLEGEPPRHHAFMYLMGNGKPDFDKAMAAIGSEWHCSHTAFKPYPVGIVIVGPVEMCLELVATRTFTPDDIASVTITTYKEAYHFTGKIYTTPQSSEIECFLSTPFCVAVALIDGEMTLRQRLESRLRDPATHELASRVVVREDPEMSRRYPREWPARIDIRLRNGEIVSRQSDQVKWSPQRPASWDQLAEKFSSMAEPTIGRDRTAAAIRIIEQIDEIDQVSSLTRLLQPAV